MTDRELLELAAKAAGYGEVWYLDGHDTPYIGQKFKLGEPIGYQIFNPLADDGDALRLAVKLFFEIDTGLGCIAIRHLSGIKILESFNNNPYTATRRAIVRAAAEIGKEMK